MTGTETEEKEVDTEDNLAGNTAHLKQKKSLYFFVCLQVVHFIFSCLIKVHCVEGFIMTLYSKHAVNYELEKLKIGQKLNTRS